MGKSKSSSNIARLFFALVLGAVILIYTSSSFERDDVKVTMKNNGYWNLKQPLNISLTDESGIKSYKLTFRSAKNETVLAYEKFMDPQRLLNIEVKPPRSAFALKEKNITLVLEVQDSSSWNFLNGNRSKKEFKFIIDKRRPQSSIVSNSYKISKGGSALVIFKVLDENLKEIYIESNNNKKFKPQSFYKDGYYISLLAWPLRDKTFKATIVAKDHAGNISKTNIPLYLKQKKYRISNIKLSDRFLQGKIADLAEEFTETQGISDPIEQFKIINEDVRAKNEKLIHTLASKIDETRISEFKINRMYPLKNGKVVANFGDYRKYYYKNEKVSEAYHLGLDLASNAMAAIKPQNKGTIVFSDYNGLYGNMPMIHHGLGLYTIYGHCSGVNVSVDEDTNAKDNIANTGKSGYAMGDHLHFGVLVQGIEVRPQEWMDRKWIKLNITNVIKDAKEIINQN